MSADNATNLVDRFSHVTACNRNRQICQGYLFDAVSDKYYGMDRDSVNKICGTFPGAVVSDPWGGGHDMWKVGDKSFASIGSVGVGVSIKCVDQPTADLLIEVGRAQKAPYLPRGGWVQFPFGSLEQNELAERLRASYDVVFTSLTKKRQREILGL